MKREMEILREYGRQTFNRNVVAAVILCLCIGVFWLYHVPGAAISYVVILCISILIVASICEYYFFRKGWQERRKLFASIEYNLDTLPATTNQIERDYRMLLRMLLDEKSELINKEKQKQVQLKEYIMMWTHQIKTPITAMNLLLQNEQLKGDMTEESLRRSRYLKEELFAIESYVKMNLQYIRMDSMNADLDICECNIEVLTKDVIRQFSQIFVHKKISVKLEHLEYTVITDEKWLHFVLEQLLSNALKYTKKGRVTFRAGEEKEAVYLEISDTGVGIAKENLPRLFEMSFTGYNGHKDKRSTGIGLYLCKEILDRLGHQITITSELDKGTCVRITFLTKV